MPFMTANTLVMVRTVVDNRAQVLRCFRYVTVTSGCGTLASIFKNTAIPMPPSTSRPTTINQLASASFPASLKAIKSEPMDTVSGNTPSQSMGMVSSAVDSRVNNRTLTTPIAQMTAMTQKIERNPNVTANQPPARASTPAIPPLTEAKMPISNAYCFSLGTCCRSIIKVREMVGPQTP